jgi:hypothetical protein
MPAGAEDLRQILSLHREYGATLDEKRFDAHMELWTDDAVLNVFGKDRVGRAAIRHFMENGYRGKHVTAVPTVEIDGTRASALSDFVFFREGNFTLYSTGIYDDELLHQAGRWRFTRRRIEIQYQQRD